MAERVLIIGSGGREIAIAQAIAGSAEQVAMAPGNPGSEQIPNAVNMNFGLTDPDKIVDYAVENNSLVIVGPEAPLIDYSLADRLRNKNVMVVGPGEDATWLEGSKNDAVRFYRQYGIPHPETKLIEIYGNPHSIFERAMKLLGTDVTNKVIKASGRAGGKGVVLPSTLEEAEDTIRGMISGKLFNGAGEKAFQIQRRYKGPEITATVIYDGKNWLMLPFSQDHKRRDKGDKGPNTGGVGAYAPVPKSILSAKQINGIYDIVERTVYGLKDQGIDYRGVITIDVMLAKEINNQKLDGDPIVIEHNIRFGDPQAQVIIPLADLDFYQLMRKAAEGTLGNNFPAPHPQDLGRAALAVCLAAPGYPDDPILGQVIYGLNRSYSKVTIQQANTARKSDKVIVAGGRAVFVTGFGEGKNAIDEATDNSYRAIGKRGLHFEGNVQQVRPDIGHQARHRKIN